MFFARYVLSSALILQMIVGQVALPARAQTPVPENSSSESSQNLTNDQRAILAASSELESSDGASLPASQTEAKDAFLLTGQTLTAFRGSATDYDLSSLDLNLPDFVITDPAKEIDVGLDAQGSLQFTLKRNGATLATHTISKAKPLAWARDQELLVYLDQSGTYRAIDMGYAKTALFRSPLPVIELLKSKVDLARLNSVKLQFLKRDQAPFQLNPNATEGVRPIEASTVLKAGDLIVSASDAQAATFVEDLSRSVIRTQVYTAESILSFLAMRLNPEQLDVEIAKLKALPQANDALSTATESVDPFVKASIQAIPPEAVTTLKSRAQTNLDRTNERVDQFTFQEWQEHYQALASKISAQDAAAASTSAAKKFSPRQLVTRFLTPKSLKIMAGLTAGGALAYGAVQVLGGMNDGAGPAWAMHLMNEAYTHMIPAVLKDSAYRMTLLKSSISLLAFIPLLWGIGFLGAKKSGKSWKPAKMIASMGMKVYAVIQLPFYHRLAGLVKQRSFLNAMRMGLNPLQKIKADSPIGKQLGLSTDIVPAVNNPMWKAKSGNQSELKTAATKALIQQKERLTTLSWMLASVVASEDAKISDGVDPATLAVLGDQASSGGLAMNADEIGKYLDSPEFRAKWEQVAIELERELVRAKDPAIEKSLVKDIEQLSPEELGRLYSLAKQTQAKIQSRSALQAKIAKLRTHWKRISVSSLQGIANFGLAENRFLKKVEPSDFVVNQFWKQFLVDYSLAVAQMGLIGARANLSDPQALAASEHGILWTNPGHFSDMFGQVRVYGISVPSSMALVYQRAAEITDDSYRPPEDTALEGVTQKEGFFKGLVSWAKGAGNLTQADYGAIWVKRLVRSLKTIQAGYLMMMIERILIGGQNFAVANLAFVYMTVWSTWQFGWMWEPITRGNQMYQEHLSQSANELAEIKSALGTAIRLDDPVAMPSQMAMLQELYEKSSVNLPKNLATSIDEMFDRLERLDVNQIVALKTDFAQSTEEVSALRAAIVNGDAAALKTARKQLTEAYRAAGAEEEAVAALMKLNAVSMLEFSMQHPPFAVKPHGGVEWFTTMMGAVLTTYYATSLSVDTFRENVSWGTKIAEASLMSAGLYVGTYYAPRVWKKWIVPTAKKLHDGLCNLILIGKFRANE